MTPAEEKNQILDALFRSGKVQEIAKNIGKKYFVCEENLVHEDVAQQCFLILAKMAPERIIQLHSESKAGNKHTHLVNYCISIINTAGFGMEKAGKKQTSMSQRIQFASTLKHNLTINPQDMNNEENNHTLYTSLLNEDYEPNVWEAMWNKACEVLTTEEQAFIERWLTLKKKQGKNREGLYRFNILKEKIECYLTGKPERKRRAKRSTTPQPKKVKKGPRTVDQLTLEGEYVQTFTSAKETAAAINARVNRVFRVLSGYEKSIDGFTYRYTPAETLEQINQECEVINFTP